MTYLLINNSHNTNLNYLETDFFQPLFFLFFDKTKEFSLFNSSLFIERRTQYQRSNTFGIFVPVIWKKKIFFFFEIVNYHHLLFDYSNNNTEQIIIDRNVSPLFSIVGIKRGSNNKCIFLQHYNFLSNISTQKS